MDTPLTIVAAAAAIKRGSLAPADLVTACLERIERFEPRSSSWVSVDREGALEAADRLGRELLSGRNRGPLHGIPLGIKDIVDVAGMPTRAGSKLTDSAAAREDATVVARVRAAGAIILGKTVTTEFACFDPPPTKNPWNAAATPGGSSSGSAAATALAMCLGAIGSQTGGSITRPASFCGVAGVKPTFGRVSRAGVLPLAFHLDHVGPMARSAADCAVMLAAIVGPDARDPGCSARAGFELGDDLDRLAAGKPPRLGVIRPYFFETADAETAELTEAALRSLESLGAKAVELPLPEYFDNAHAMHRRIMAAEAADFHRAAYGAPRQGYSPRISELLAEGFAITLAEYQEALRHQTAFRNAMERTLAGVDAVAIPSTVGPAPDATTTGDPRFNSVWSHAGVPTVSIPCGLTKAGMPLSLQLLGRAWSEMELLRTAVWCEERLEFNPTPAPCSAKAAPA
jgi:aspartyl-tRNA(Asn)/glutamyl-tRNA(Gln) amidotransferase subunit A